MSAWNFFPLIIHFGLCAIGVLTLFDPGPVTKEIPLLLTVNTAEQFLLVAYSPFEG
jgi:hypothetical protein